MKLKIDRYKSISYPFAIYYKEHWYNKWEIYNSYNNLDEALEEYNKLKTEKVPIYYGKYIRIIITSNLTRGFVIQIRQKRNTNTWYEKYMSDNLDKAKEIAKKLKEDFDKLPIYK